MITLFKYAFGILALLLNSACANGPNIETKREYDNDKAMQHYLTEKKSLEPTLNSLLKKCSSKSGSLVMHWHLNREGKATDISLTDDTLNCPEVSNLLKNHLNSLSFPKPQLLDRVELEYAFNLGKPISN
jgi:hypothetical protein